jgi:hypothetical protein
VLVPQLFGHDRPQLDAFVHVTSHEQASLQSTLLHDPLPLHVIAHAPVQVTESQDLSPVHAIVHDAADEQLTLRQPLLPHVIVQ